MGLCIFISVYILHELWNALLVIFLFLYIAWYLCSGITAQGINDYKINSAQWKWMGRNMHAEVCELRSQLRRQRNCSGAKKACVMQRPTLDMWALPTTTTPSPLPSCYDSSQTLIYVWFTAKRKALWISLLFNLSQRPLKTSSNALISYSEERLIYRYACHLLLLVFLNKAWRYRWCLDQSYRGLYLEMLAFLKFIHLFF